MITDRVIFLFLLFFTQSTFAAHGSSQAELLKTRTIGSFPAPLANFSAYRQKVKDYLKANSLSNRTQSDINLNLPFELTAKKTVPYRGKFLLIHGLNDSAYVWADMARAISDRGFDVRAILLPGHGSHPADMLRVTYREWLRAARSHLTFWNTDSTPIYLGGFSLGGVIASILALENRQINGLLLVSPAYHSQLNSYLRWSWLYARFKPWMFGGMLIEDNPAKYNSIPINSAWQYYRTTRYLKNRWNKNVLDIPVLMVVSEDDSVVDITYTRNIFRKRFSSDHKKLMIYTTDTKTIASKNEIIRLSQYLDRRILNQSHLSLINAPVNPLLGENGTQLICNGNKYPIFMACMQATGHWYGAQYTESPDGVAVARTTYNPDFHTILEQFDRIFLLSGKIVPLN